MREKGDRVDVLSEGRKVGREDSDPNGIGLYGVQFEDCTKFELYVRITERVPKNNDSQSSVRKKFINSLQRNVFSLHCIYKQI